MKKFITLKKQKIVMCIPAINCLTIFFWLYNYGKLNPDPKIFWKSLVTIFSTALPIVVLQIILSKIFSELSYVLDPFMTYLIPFCISFSLIRYQKKVGVP